MASLCKIELPEVISVCSGLLLDQKDSVWLAIFKSDYIQRGLILCCCLPKKDEWS